MLMLYLAVALIAVAVFAAVLFVVEMVPARSAALSRRLAELHEEGGVTPDILRRRRRQAQAERISGIIQALGERVTIREQDVGLLRQRLIQAGYPSPNAVTLYLGARLALPMVLGGAALVFVPVLGLTWRTTMLIVLWMAGTGYVLPTMIIGSKVRSRQKEMQRALPDALDMLVVCVEAGLALNQALVRVSEEIERVSTVLSEQIALVNLEIRAGTARDEAMRNLGERTGLADIKSLVAMLIQTDRFGTSIATALRVHADTLRTKRRQRAEEAAAKTTIKLVFPLVLFIFPAMFVVILGPALIQIFEALSNFK